MHPASDRCFLLSSSLQHGLRSLSDRRWECMFAGTFVVACFAAKVLAFEEMGVLPSSCFSGMYSCVWSFCVCAPSSYNSTVNLRAPIFFPNRVCLHVCTGAPVVPLGRCVHHARVDAIMVLIVLSGVCMYLELVIMHCSVDSERGSHGNGDIICRPPSMCMRGVSARCRRRPRACSQTLYPCYAIYQQSPIEGCSISLL